MDEQAALDGVHVLVLSGPNRGGDGLGADDFDDVLAGVDDHAIDRISVGDHQGNHWETYAALGYMAARTRKVALGAYVTNVVARDPGTHAAALASLDALTRGRAYWVVGRGDGAIRNLGLTPSSIAGTREALVAIRGLLTEGTATLGDRTIRLRWPEPPASRIPLCIAGAGPRILEAAGAVADGVYLATGVIAEDVAENVERVAAAARAAGRDTTPESWWVTRFGIGASDEEALASVSESLSSIGNHSLRGTDFAAKRIPRRLWGPLREYHERYDWSRKNVSGPGPSNVDLMHELGLTDYFLERFAVVGTPETIVERIRELSRRGVRRIVVKVESREQLDLLGRDVLPHVTAPRDRAARPTA